MKTSSIALFALLAAAAMLLPLYDFVTQGYTGFLGYMVLLVSVSALIGILYLMRALPKAIRRDLEYNAELSEKIDKLRQKLSSEFDHTTGHNVTLNMQKLRKALGSRDLNRYLELRSRRRNGEQDKAIGSAEGLSILSFVVILLTSAIWFDAIRSDNTLYDQTTRQIVDNNSFRVYFWQTPADLRQVSWQEKQGSFTDTRPYQHHATGQILGYNTQTWESTFELSYTVPDAELVRSFQNGHFPNYKGKMRVVFRDSVDFIYYKGLGNFPTTSDLQNALRREVRSRCAAAFGTESCPVNFRLNVPHFPRRGAVNPGPGDNST